MSHCSKSHLSLSNNMLTHNKPHTHFGRWKRANSRNKMSQQARHITQEVTKTFSYFFFAKELKNLVCVVRLASGLRFFPTRPQDQIKNWCVYFCLLLPNNETGNGDRLLAPPITENQVVGFLSGSLVVTQQPDNTVGIGHKPTVYCVVHCTVVVVNNQVLLFARLPGNRKFGRCIYSPFVSLVCSEPVTAISNRPVMFFITDAVRIKVKEDNTLAGLSLS